jgi:hypothetical protein
MGATNQSQCQFNRIVYPHVFVHVSGRLALDREQDVVGDNASLASCQEGICVWRFCIGHVTTSIDVWESVVCDLQRWLDSDVAGRRYY